MSFEAVVQNSIYQCLQSNSALSSVVSNRIYDSVPQAVTFPYVTIGEDIHTDWSTAYELGSSASITIHVWSRHRGKEETKTIQGLIYDALNRASLPTLGYKISVDFDGSQSFLDADGLTRHGVSTFRVFIEKFN